MNYIREHDFEVENGNEAPVRYGTAVTAGENERVIWFIPNDKGGGATIITLPALWKMLQALLPYFLEEAKDADNV